ncbi:MAG: hypothetical protein ACR2G3_03875 [Solirubrobacterales bacterium]
MRIIGWTAVLLATGLLMIGLSTLSRIWIGNADSPDSAYLEAAALWVLSALLAAGAGLWLLRKD